MLTRFAPAAERWFAVGAPGIAHGAEAAAERVGQSTDRGRRHQQWDEDNIGTCAEVCEAALNRECDTFFVIVTKAQKEHIRPRVDR